jgi:two-component system cell cycle response regulator
MDGLEICRRLKARDQTRNIQVLLLARLSDLRSNALSFPIGADDLLVKPLNGIELQVRIGTLLRKKTYLDRLHHIKENNFNEGITDPGTGLYNRSFLRHFLNLEVKRSLRQKYPLTLLMCAICDFPEILNSRGPEAGERILGEVGHLLQENFREIDLPVHCGEEVFAMVLPYTDASGTLKGAARVRKVIQDHSFLKDTSESPLKIDIQMGIALYSSPELKADEFIRKAEEALYQAKKEGKPFLLLEDIKKMVP